ncbi:MAG: alpha/beta hydrolase [Methylobacterium mesophilicum]|nr:alpha/beta hydrolase [Methylobacterium mesophilicum]
MTAETTATSPSFTEVDGTPIATLHQPGSNPGLVWLGGYRSDMRGTKAEALAAYAQEHGLAFTRHDYSGHGESGGDFSRGTISRWLNESLAVFQALTQGPQILVGSSMGAWIALRMAQELQAEKGRVAGLVLIAPAPDFTSDLVAPKMTEEQKRDVREKGFFAVPSDYSDEPYTYSHALLDDGEKNRLLTKPLDTHCPVHILQGLADPDVPHTHALKLVSHLPADDVTLSLVPDGDHRLSRPEDLALLTKTLSNMIRQIAA